MISEIRGYVLLTVIDCKYTLMVVDNDGFETLEFDNYQQAMEAKAAWENFLYED